MSPPARAHPAIISRIKIMASMDISERRVPQDGGMRVIISGRAIDIRVSTMPGHAGEKVVLRVIDCERGRVGIVLVALPPGLSVLFVLICMAPGHEERDLTIRHPLGTERQVGLPERAKGDPRSAKLAHCFRQALYVHRVVRLTAFLACHPTCTIAAAIRVRDRAEAV